MRSKALYQCISCSEIGTSSGLQPNPFTREHECGNCGSLFRRCLLPIYKSSTKVSLKEFKGCETYSISYFAERYKQPMLEKVIEKEENLNNEDAGVGVGVSVGDHDNFIEIRKGEIMHLLQFEKQRCTDLKKELKISQQAIAQLKKNYEELV